MKNFRVHSRTESREDQRSIWAGPHYRFVMANSVNVDSAGDTSSVPKPPDVRIDKSGATFGAGSSSDTQIQAAMALVAEGSTPPAYHRRQPDAGSPSTATSLRRQRKPSDECSAKISSSHAGSTRKRADLYVKDNSRDVKMVAATTTTTTTTKRGETPRAKKPSAQHTGSAARNSPSLFAAESSRKALESPNKNSSRRKIESPSMTTSTAGKDLETKKRRDLERERYYTDNVACDMITPELQHQPREFSSSEGTTESVSRSTTTTRKGSVISAQVQTRRTIREDAGATVKTGIPN
ncbi:hypothetical protein MRX96_030109 [Rhipicephalus microplus]